MKTVVLLILITMVMSTDAFSLRGISSFGGWTSGEVSFNN